MTRHQRTTFAALFALASLTACQAPKAPFDATLVFSNGLMGGIEPCDCPSSPMGGVARQATILKEVRQANPRVVLLDGGDTLLGTEQSDADGGQTMIEAMNRLGYHAMVLGEQDQLPPAKLAQRVAAAHFPIMGRVNGVSLAGHTIVEQDGKRFGVVSITRGRDEGSRLPLLRARLAAMWLKGQVDLIVGISHLTEVEDREIAKQLPELHVLFSGHPRGTGATSWVGKTLVVHGYALGGKALSTLKVTFDPQQSKVSEIKLQRIGLGPKVPDDPEMRAWLPHHSASMATLKRWPNLPITTLDGKAVFPSTLKGVPGLVLVSCWCPKCQTVAQGLDTLQRAHPEWGIRILSLGSAQNTAYQVKRLHLGLSVFVDQGGKSFERLGKPDCPHIYRLDAKGKVTGEYTSEQISPQRLEDLLRDV